MTANPLVLLGRLGQSPWYDFITRELVSSGELARLIADDGLLGMTTNPTIFEKAVAGGEQYDDQIRRLAAAGRTPAEIFEALAVADVRAACDRFTPVYERTAGGDGLVSIEVSPTLAHDTAATILEAEQLGQKVPPGICAEFGYALFEEGQAAESLPWFQREKETWPESTVLMDKMIRNAGRRIPQPRVENPDVDAVHPFL